MSLYESLSLVGVEVELGGDGRESFRSGVCGGSCCW